jgi:hypothetical protein
MVDNLMVLVLLILAVWTFVAMALAVPVGRMCAVRSNAR